MGEQSSGKLQPPGSQGSRPWRPHPEAASELFSKAFWVMDAILKVSVSAVVSSRMAGTYIVGAQKQLVASLFDIY